MPDSPSTASASAKVAATAAFFEYARENDRLLAFQLCLLHGAIALTRALGSIGTESSSEALAELGKLLGTAGTRDPRPDEVWLQLHDSVIAEMLTARQVDNFLTYIVQLLTIVFAARPEMLRSHEHVRVDLVLSHPDKESLVRALIERRVDRLAYLGMRELEDDLQQRLGFSLFTTPGDLEAAVTLIETRNVIVHNRGIVSKIAASRAPTLAPELGKLVGLTSNKLTEHRAFFWKLVREIDDRAVKKFRLSPVGALNAAEISEPPNKPLQPASGSGTTS